MSSTFFIWWLSPLTIETLPIWYWYVVSVGFGLIIGSFLNVYIYRLHTGKSLSGVSHCLSCGHRLAWYELVPVLSFILLRGRCQYCRCRIALRYLVVEILTAGLFATGLLVSSVPLVLLAWWVVVSILVVLVVYDIQHFIVPDELVVALTLAVFGWHTARYFAGELYSLTSLTSGLLASLAGVGFFFLLWLGSRGRALGFGDVKLALPLGLLVGPSLVFSFVVLSFWIGAVVSLVWVGITHYQYRRGKAHLQLSAKALTMKSAVPFAPFLIASSLISTLTHFDVLSLFTSFH